eukprot:TRINITY_DN5455_c0_g1_i1.p1 TRINITY_DN5455_c0_g1~~TRINITY_DN5455_c0_g1_i1.p1  ORF type:complete len:497 (-),score=163.82 TRINITY_DN5455_c0_g1_i1:93-1559(-)
MEDIDESRGRSMDRKNDHSSSFHYDYSQSNSHHQSSSKFSASSAIRKYNGHKRVRRWDDPNKGFKIPIPGIPTTVPGDLPKDILHAITVRVRIDEITQKLVSPAGGFEADILQSSNNEDRSPSPDPIYDGNGKRLNTRDVRMRDNLLKERQKLIDFATKMHPYFRPPYDHRPLFNKKYRKIPIPIKEYPDYNFIGLIIGPRGMTQKNMEKETNCKIAIRGRGSMKDGKSYTKGKGIDPKISSDDEDIHVFITGETEEEVEKAAEIVRKLLEPMDESQNEHKRMQLRTLAQINGTLRENAWVDKFERRPGPEIICKICGDGSHPSYDCPTKRGFKEKLDNEFEAFMSEIGEAVPKDQMDKEYEDLMRSIGASDSAPGEPQPPPPSSTPPWAKNNGFDLPPPPPPPVSHHLPPPPPPTSSAPWTSAQQGAYPQQAYGYYPPEQFQYGYGDPATAGAAGTAPAAVVGGYQDPNAYYSGGYTDPKFSQTNRG